MIRCPNCNRLQPNSVAICDCGTNLEEFRETSKRMDQTRAESERPFHLLPVLGHALRWAGILPVIGGLVGATYAYSQMENPWMAVFIFLGGIVPALLYFAFAEALTVLLDIHTQQKKLLEQVLAEKK